MNHSDEHKGDGFDDSAPPIDYFADLPEPVAGEGTLEKLMALATESRDLDERIAVANTVLAELQDRQTKILRELIPGIMDAIGMESFALSDGAKIEVKDDVKCGITQANRPAAHDWLRGHDFDGIIKTKVVAEFGKGELQRAEAALRILELSGYGASMDESVHPSTLKSFVKEQLENGTSIPQDLFGVFEFRQAKIVLPRTRR